MRNSAPWTNVCATCASWKSGVRLFLPALTARASSTRLSAARSSRPRPRRGLKTYLPYKPKRRTKAQIAREAGLEPLAEILLGNPERVPEQSAEAFVDAEKRSPGC